MADTEQSIDSSTSNDDQILVDENVSLGGDSNASSTNETSYVRRMTRQFEQMTADRLWIDKGQNENFKQCNWWLKTPSIVTTFDDFDVNGTNEEIDLDGNRLTTEW